MAGIVPDGRPFAGDMDPGTWHRETGDDAWRKVTLAHHEGHGFGLIMYCKFCCRRSAELSPRALSERFGVPMDTPLKIIERSMRCSKCNRPAGQLLMVNHGVPGDRSRERGEDATGGDKA